MTETPDPTTTPPEPLDLAPIRARVEAATPGPWVADPDEAGIVLSSRNGGWDGRTVAVLQVDDDGLLYNPADAEFIAHARQDVPALLAEVERLRAVTTVERLAATTGATIDEAARGLATIAADFPAAAPDERAAFEGLPERFRFSREVYGDVADDATRVLLALTDGGHADQPSDHLRWVSITAAQALAARPARGERATDPLIVSAIRRHPSGTLRYEPANGPATGTSGRSFLAEYDAALAARPAPTVNAADVRAGVLAACWPNGDALDGISARTADLITASVMRHLGLTVADEGRAGA